MGDSQFTGCPGRREPSSARTQGGPISGHIGPTEDAAMRRFAAAAPRALPNPSLRSGRARGSRRSIISSGGDVELAAEVAGGLDEGLGNGRAVAVTVPGQADQPGRHAPLEIDELDAGVAL